MEYFDYYDSPLGRMLMVASDTALTGLHFTGDKHFPAMAADWRLQPAAAMLLRARGQLDEYFAGTRTQFALAVAPQGTPFQQRVWRALQDIPHGVTISYGELARRIGQPTASRAVGLANGRNPVSIVIPCHRVIGANGALTGYAAGVERKQALLRLEAARAADFVLQS